MVLDEDIIDEIKKGNLSVKLEYKGKIRLSGEIEALSGILIAGGTEEIEIGKIDKTFIKDPVTGLPYIPGSSLKGVMRSMLEYKYSKISESGKVHNCSNPDCEVCRVFGTAKESYWGPTRVHVIDGLLTEETKTKLEERGLWTYTELKTENFINRIFGKAENPRTFERVPPGSKFHLNIDYFVFSGNLVLIGQGAEISREDIDKINDKLKCEKDIEHFRYLLESLVLAEDHGLGASISRGYGKIKITIKSIEVRNKSYYVEGKDPIKLSINEIIGKNFASPKELLANFNKLKSKLVKLLCQ